MTPLHHLLARALGFPVVATSGNLSEEPIVTDEAQALDRLGAIADLFLDALIPEDALAPETVRTARRRG